MTSRRLLIRTACWSLIACLTLASATIEPPGTRRIPRSPEAGRTPRGGTSTAGESRRDDLLRWLTTETAGDHADPSARTAAFGAAEVARPFRFPPDACGARPTDRAPARCRST
jgi:hypothetical protein